MRGNPLLLVLAILVGPFAFAGIGLLLASRTDKTETISGLINLVMLPGWLLSGTFFSAKRFPDVVAAADPGPAADAAQRRPARGDAGRGDRMARDLAAGHPGRLGRGCVPDCLLPLPLAVRGRWSFGRLPRKRPHCAMWSFPSSTSATSIRILVCDDLPIDHIRRAFWSFSEFRTACCHPGRSQARLPAGTSALSQLDSRVAAFARTRVPRTLASAATAKFSGSRVRQNAGSPHSGECGYS